MGTSQDHRRWAEDCVAMARATDDQSDKALWLTLAQSWVRLAEHVARAGNPDEMADGDSESALEVHESLPLAGHVAPAGNPEEIAGGENEDALEAHSSE